MPKTERCEICGCRIPPHETAFLVGQRVLCEKCRELAADGGRRNTPDGWNKRRSAPPAEAADAIDLLTEPTSWVVDMLRMLCVLFVLAGAGAIAWLNRAGNIDVMFFPTACIAISTAVVVLLLAALAQCVKTHFERLAQIVKALSSDKTPPK